MSNSVVRIVGTVTALQTSTTSEDFVSGSGDKVAGGAAAVGLASVGLAGAATGAAISSSDAADKVTSFACKVDGQNVKGRFGEVTFAEGDEVEVVGSMFFGNFSALAVARPSDRTIWMHPHCSRGTKAYWKYCLRWIPTLAIATPAVMFTAATLVSDAEVPPIWFQLASVGAAALMFGAVGAIVARRFFSFAKLSDQIFAGLQFDDPKAVDLPKRLSQAKGSLSPQERMNYHPWKRWVYKY
jgi:hypothetical protein